MRLLSFVPCGCRAGPIDDAPPAADHHAAAAAAAARRRRRRRRAAAAAARSVGAAPPQYWRPSLGDIYEEEYCSSDAAAKASTGAGPGRKAWDVARVLHRDEYRHVPAFAPTAYLF